MAHQVNGVIAGSKGAAVSIQPILVPDPGPGEALIRVKACGVCHTDLHYREGAINDDFPFLLGHEASGTVESVGTGVNNVAPATSWSSPGVRPAALAGPVCEAVPGIASPAATPASP